MKKVYIYAVVLWLAGTAIGLVFNHSKPSSAAKKEAAPVVVNVSAQGYTPSNIELQSGAAITINFKTTGYSSCLSQIQSSDLGIKTRDLKVGDNLITIQDPKPGVYHYSCGMEMAEGTITIK